MTPNAVKESKVYSIIPSNGNGDLDFTRGTLASSTLNNASGLIESVPYNLVLRSEEFNDSNWVKYALTITPNSINSPNGTLTADTLIGDGQNAFRYLLQNGSSTSGVTYTTSVFAKKGTNNFMQIIGPIGVYTSGLVFANFDLNNGVVGSLGSGTTSSITDFGNGWYRCTMTATATGTSALSSVIGFSLINSATSPRAEVNALTTSIYLWGAQLVQGSIPKDYFFTTDRLNVPRLNYDSVGGCPSLLLEPQRMNRLLNSAVVVTQTIATTGVACTVSFYGTGTIVFSGTYVGTLVGTGVNNRVTLTFTPTTGSLVLTVTGSVTKGQLETGSYPTSYIPTTTSAVTRNADTFTRNNIYTNGLITSVGGTWFIELNNNVPLIRDAFSYGISLNSTSTVSGNGFLIRATSTSRLIIDKVISGATQTLFTTFTNTVKIAIKWNGVNSDWFINGVKEVSATAFTATAMEFLIGNGTDTPKSIKSTYLYPTPLTDAECIALTQ